MTSYYAVIIGYSDYTRQKDYTNMLAAKNDVKQVVNSLNGSYFEKKGQIQVFVDEDREKIIKALDELREAIKQESKNGHVAIYLYYSGHGLLEGSDTHIVPG